MNDLEKAEGPEGQTRPPPRRRRCLRPRRARAPTRSRGANA
jgi:hypothetical protein